MSRSDSGRPVLRQFLARGFLQAYAEFVGEATADELRAMLAHSSSANGWDEPGSRGARRGHG